MFGDIGTSPIYTIQTLFNPGDPHPVPISTQNVYGIVIVLLADTSLICEPDFYRVDADRLLTRDCVQARGEAFLKFSIAPAACA